MTVHLSDQLCSNANTHSAHLLLLQAAPDSTRFTQCRISLYTISLIPHTHTCAEPDLTYPTHSHLGGNRFDCAADFALLNLPKGKSLGRSKPETNSSNEQAH